MLERLSPNREQINGQEMIDIVSTIVEDSDRLGELNDQLADALSQNDEPAIIKATAKPGFSDVITPIRFQDGKPSPTEVSGNYSWVNERGTLILREGFKSGWRVHVLGADQTEQVDLEVIYPNESQSGSL
jgi:hypothetical protein